VVALWGAGQTINIMTLGGLALAVGILVDESTVVMENIHSHLAQGQPRARAVLEASKEVIVPRLLAMLCVLAVFVPSFFMTGVPRSLFVPLSLAVGFAMAASYFLSSSLVPVMSTWVLREHRDAVEPAARDPLASLRDMLGRLLAQLGKHRRIVIAAYLVVSLGIIFLIAPRLGREIFPHASAGQMQIRFRAPTGSRVSVTEQTALAIEQEVRRLAGANNVEITLGYVGSIPTSYPVNTISLWMSGPQDGILRVALKPDSTLNLDELQAQLRKNLQALFPDTKFSFEAGDIVSQIMNFGAPTPVEVAVSGPDFSANRDFIAKVRAELSGIASLRDLQLQQPLDYPSLNVNINRQMAGQLGVTVQQVGDALVDATSSSRFVTPTYWADPRSGVAYQVQVQIPQPRMTSLADLQDVPLTAGTAQHPLLGDLAQVNYGTVVGEYDRYNGQRLLTLTANVVGEDLGRAAGQVNAAVSRAGAPPRGVTVSVRGQIAPMNQTLTSLGVGLVLAVVVIFLLLSANFQSMRLSFVVLSTVPAVVAGVVLALSVTRTTLNIESFMGAIMAIGVSVANSILLVVFAEQNRMEGAGASDAGRYGAQSRMRPILMTSMAMVAGMLPMALAIGTGAEETAPLGRAVIGGLLASTLATLIILPSVFSVVQGSASTQSPSLDPDDPRSAHA
jgi:multidrug efflux pump subunit AcrB